MALTKEELRHIARLAAMSLSDDELEKMQHDLENIFGHVARLSEVITRGVEPTYNVHGHTNFFRDDITKESLAVEEVEKNAPDFAQGGFRVPKIVG
jgi:aspartyl-tRNA(Asn)/glutamyl-tRNA(Gln) amidotransferase subunit C